MMGHLHVFSILSHAQEAHTRLWKMGHRPFPIFEFYGNGREEWAFWTDTGE